MIHLTHYAVRDLHALFPDDERYPAWDVVAKDNNGCVYYSEDVMDSAEQARAFIDGQCTNPYGLDWWRDKAVLPDHVRVPDKDWIEVPDEEPEPSGEAAGRAAYIENLVRSKARVTVHVDLEPCEGETRERLIERALTKIEESCAEDMLIEVKEGTTK